MDPASDEDDEREVFISIITWRAKQERANGETRGSDLLSVHREKEWLILLSLALD